MLCDSLLVAMASRVPLTLLGFGDEYKGNFQKLTGAMDYVASLPADALVLFADAYDVLYAKGPDAILEAFYELRVPPSKVLFMGERGCWPDWDMGPIGRRFCQQRYPTSPTPYRYVNSGVWMGRAAAAHRLLTTLASYTPGLDDQHVTGHLFVDQPEWFTLDRHATLMQSMHGNHEGHAADVVPARGQAREPIVRNALTNARPLVLHFNGGAKGDFDRFRDHLLSTAPCLPVHNATFSTGSIPWDVAERHSPSEYLRPLRFRDICPGHRLPKGKRAC